MHMDEGTLQAVIDEELPSREREDVVSHLADCGRCRDELRLLREERATLSSALRMLDVPAPMLAAQARIKREARRRRWFAGGAALRRAALFLLVSTAAVSATVPGSPLRGWLADRWPSAAVGPPVEETATMASAPETRAGEHAAGVSLLPRDGLVRVRVTAPAEGMTLRVRLHDEERLGVWATGAAATARFQTAADRVEVEGAGPGELQVEVPRSARRVVVEVDGHTYLEKEGEQLRFPGPPADRQGPVFRFEVGP